MDEPRYERRKHKRHPLECPVRMTDATGNLLASARGINISDGGMLFPAPSEALPERGSRIHLDFSVPRATPNTFLMEEFTCKAFVIREEPSDGDGPVRVAVEFERPLDLEIEV